MISLDGRPPVRVCTATVPVSGPLSWALYTPLPLAHHPRLSYLGRSETELHSGCPYLLPYHTEMGSYHLKILFNVSDLNIQVNEIVFLYLPEFT